MTLNHAEWVAMRCTDINVLNGIIPSKLSKPSQSSEHFRTTVLKVGSNDEIVREIKRNQQLKSHRIVAGVAQCNLGVTGSSFII